MPDCGHPFVLVDQSKHFIGVSFEHIGKFHPALGGKKLFLENSELIWGGGSHR